MRNIPGRYARKISGWRKVASSTWARPNDPVIHGFIELDMEAAYDYTRRLSRATGRRVTVTHLLVKVLADALRRHPECNGMIRWGKVYLRDHVDLSVLVEVDPAERTHDQGADLTAALIRDADRKSMLEIAEELSGGVRSIRRHHDPFLGVTKKVFKLLPPGILRWGLNVVALLQYQFNIDLSFTRFIPRDPFGSAMITSVSMFGIDEAIAPIPPFIWISMLLSVGAMREKPVAVDGRVEIRKRLTVGAAIDHRVIDGYQGGVLLNEVRRILENPEATFGPVEKFEVPAARPTVDEMPQEITRPH